jgi:hypothetical protein
MAKINGPLFSISASGSLGKELTFSERKSGSQARYQRKQGPNKTLAQLEQQEAFRQAVILWASLFISEQDYWKQIALFGEADV